MHSRRGLNTPETSLMLKVAPVLEYSPGIATSKLQVNVSLVPPPFNIVAQLRDDVFPVPNQTLPSSLFPICHSSPIRHPPHPSSPSATRILPSRPPLPTQNVRFLLYRPRGVHPGLCIFSCIRKVHLHPTTRTSPATSDSRSSSPPRTTTTAEEGDDILRYSAGTAGQEERNQEVSGAYH